MNYSAIWFWLIFIICLNLNTPITTQEVTANQIKIWNTNTIELLTWRKLIDSYIIKYAISKWTKSINSYFNYWYENKIKPEVAICIAVSETGLWKHMQWYNIGNVWIHAWWSFPTLDKWIEAIYTKALNGRYMITKQTIGDLYKNWNCKINCMSRYASGPHAQPNVLTCLSDIYWTKISADFKFRLWVWDI